MDYEIIMVHEYDGNNFDRSREAKLFTNGTLEYEPEPEYDEDDELIEEEEDEDSV
jgi:hypothetical protein